MEAKTRLLLAAFTFWLGQQFGLELGDGANAGVDTKGGKPPIVAKGPGETPPPPPPPPPNQD